MSDGTRTRDRLDHNQELYQLSYAHHARDVRRRNLAVRTALAGQLTAALEYRGRSRRLKTEHEEMLQAPSYSPAPDADALSDEAWIRPLQILHRHRVEHVIAGDAAAAAYGRAHDPSTPLTIVPARYGRNLDRLRGALEDVRSSGAALVVVDRPAGTDGYRDLLADARPVTVAGLEVLVASAEDLARMTDPLDA